MDKPNTNYEKYEEIRFHFLHIFLKLKKIVANS